MSKRNDESSIKIMRHLLHATAGSKLDLVMRKLLTAPCDSPERYGVAGRGSHQLENDEIAELIHHLVEAYKREARVVCLVFDPIVNMCCSFVTTQASAKLEAIKARNRREAYTKALDILHDDGAFLCFEDAIASGISFPLVDEGIESVEVVLRYCNEDLLRVSLPCADQSASGTVRFGDVVVKCS